MSSVVLEVGNGPVGTAVDSTYLSLLPKEVAAPLVFVPFPLSPWVRCQIEQEGRGKGTNQMLGTGVL